LKIVKLIKWCTSHYWLHIVTDIEKFWYYIKFEDTFT
jgi:hypothetical protein